MGDDSGEKTEQPTPHKLSEARKKGQIAKSKEFTTVVLLVVSFTGLRVFSSHMYTQLERILSISFLQIPLEFSASIATYILKNVLIIFGFSLLPLFGINFLAAFIVEIVQVGPLLSFESIKPNFGKLNPIEGFKKFVSVKQFVELIKSLIKMAIVIFIIVSILRDEFIYVILSQELDFLQVLQIISRMIFTVIMKVAMFFVFVAIFDLFYQRHEYIKGLMMSQKEIKDEFKRLEGDPMIKQRQRDAARQMSQGRQMGAVPDADVVVTNPIHVAIALQYTPNKMKAPKVLAKGKRLLAAEIRRIADLHYIPIVENPALARKLYDSTEPGSDVPPMYYKVVAEILAFVYNLKKKRKQKF